MAEDIFKSSIIIIDDDDELRETYYDLLIAEGFKNTFQAENGVVALQMAKTQKFDLIISDLNMPEMDGIETIKKIKELHPNVMSMILTGFGNMDVAIKAFSESHINDFLSKPVENDELLEKIKSHLSKMGSAQTETNMSDMVRKEFGSQRNYFGQYLIDNGYITEEDLLEALQKQKETGKMLGDTLVEMKLMTADELVNALSEQKGYSIADDKTLAQIPEDALMKVPVDFARQHNLVPIGIEDNSLKVAMVNPDDLAVTDNLKMIAQMSIIPFYSTKEKIDKAIDLFYKKLESTASANSALSEIFAEDDVKVEEINVKDIKDEDNPDSAPIINLVNSILAKADLDGTSDIHIEPQEKYVQIRFRKDGDLYIPTGYERLPKKLQSSLAARIKVLTKTMKLDIKLRPQDGKIRMKLRGREIDFRVGTLPTIHGEKIVLRLLKTEQLFPIEGIFSGNQTYIDTFVKNIQRPDGMVLVTGPTGSGKTNTLASALNYIKNVTINIVSVEDPVEIQNEGIIQVQINIQQELTFQTALRQILRQDPDVVLIGEMRDYETAHIGCEAALTGHLVFSTLHTNDAPSTVTRFIEMGIKDYLVGTVIRLIIAQRLARSICKMCKKEYEYDKKALIGLGLTEEDIEGHKFYKGEGCPNCKGTGRAGRVAVIEMMEMTKKISSAVMRGATALEIGDIAKAEGVYWTLKEDALRHFKNGKIDLEEAMYFAL
ncbi:MAG TPA: ATPase, T2SS/T4P/T4SS family [Clostridiales bacterium]|nr:ATPase, T2SS/T4P/T4SS family [Clostridiales bacterium]HQP70108.1 ATPase, T2SS/T4P/T4SS family [Clostridiales bacterium]